MRPISNFTLHAVLAAALVALAASSAAAGEEPVVYKITLQDSKAAGADGGQQLEAQRFHWGPRQSTSTDGSVDPAEKRQHKPMNIHVELDRAATTTHQPPPPRDSSLGSVSERRQHKPVTFPTPHDRGSLTLETVLPGCEVGKRYAGAQFAAGTMQYELKDVVITNCAAGSVSLDYAKVTVRGWDPEKKEL